MCQRVFAIIHFRFSVLDWTTSLGRHLGNYNCYKCDHELSWELTVVSWLGILFRWLPICCLKEGISSVLSSFHQYYCIVGGLLLFFSFSVVVVSLWLSQFIKPIDVKDRQWLTIEWRSRIDFLQLVESMGRKMKRRKSGNLEIDLKGFLELFSRYFILKKTSSSYGESCPVVSIE